VLPFSKAVVSGDYRALTGTQPFVKNAPVTLVYVADTTRMNGAGDQLESMKWADSAFIAENVYIFAASEGLATGVRALIDRSALANALNLGPNQSITFAQCVAFPEQ
jgi:nitroreductase